MRFSQGVSPLASSPRTAPTSSRTSETKDSKNILNDSKSINPKRLKAQSNKTLAGLFPSSNTVTENIASFKILEGKHAAIQISSSSSQKDIQNSKDIKKLMTKTKEVIKNNVKEIFINKFAAVDLELEGDSFDNVLQDSFSKLKEGMVKILGDSDMSATEKSANMDNLISLSDKLGQIVIALDKEMPGLFDAYKRPEGAKYEKDGDNVTMTAVSGGKYSPEGGKSANSLITYFEDMKNAGTVEKLKLELQIPNTGKKSMPVPEFGDNAVLVLSVSQRVGSGQTSLPPEPSTPIGGVSDIGVPRESKLDQEAFKILKAGVGKMLAEFKRDGNVDFVNKYDDDGDGITERYNSSKVKEYFDNELTSHGNLNAEDFKQLVANSVAIAEDVLGALKEVFSGGLNQGLGIGQLRDDLNAAKDSVDPEARDKIPGNLFKAIEDIFNAIPQYEEDGYEGDSYASSLDEQVDIRLVNTRLGEVDLDVESVIDGDYDE